MLTGSHLIMIVSLVRHGTMLHGVAVLAGRSTLKLSLLEVAHLRHCNHVRSIYSAELTLPSRLTLCCMMLLLLLLLHRHVHLLTMSLLRALVAHRLPASKSWTWRRRG
jgi:hypothetical protein